MEALTNHEQVQFVCFFICFSYLQDFFLPTVFKTLAIAVSKVKMAFDHLSYYKNLLDVKIERLLSRFIFSTAEGMVHATAW